MISKASPALSTVRGFYQSAPTASGDEDSDHPRLSTPERRGRVKRGPVIDDVVSANCSPVLKAAPSPGMSGIAKLRLQLEPLSLEGGASLAGLSSRSSRANSMTRSESHGGGQRITSPLAFPTMTAGPADRRAQKCHSILSDATSRAQSRSRHGSSRASTSGDEASSDITTSYEILLQEDFASHDSGDFPAGDVQGPHDDGAKGGGSEENDDFDTLDSLDCSVFGEPQPALYADGVEGGLIQQPRRKITADDFEPLRCLGKGTYGTVILVRQRTTGRLYAQKQFKKASLVIHKKLVEQTKTERQILESVNRHPFVVKLFYAFQDHEKLYLILEYGQGGELFTHLNTVKLFSEAHAAFYMAEMVLALSHLHGTLGVVYRDLKPENCLLDAEGHLLLTDFGLSKVAVEDPSSPSADGGACNSILGTVEYMAPEIIQGKKYGKAVDWWGLGALGFDLMTGNPPFRGNNHAKIQDNIVHQKLVLPYYLSADAKDILTRLLRKDPAKRLGANMPRDLATIKTHRFFRIISWKKLAARELEPPIRPLITDPELAENFAPEFTELSLSPVVTARDRPSWADVDGGDGGELSRAAGDEFMARAGAEGCASGGQKEDLFGGFSFVASSSLLENEGFMLATQAAR